MTHPCQPGPSYVRENLAIGSIGGSVLVGSTISCVSVRGSKRAAKINHEPASRSTVTAMPRGENPRFDSLPGELDPRDATFFRALQTIVAAGNQCSDDATAIALRAAIAVDPAPVGVGIRPTMRISARSAAIARTQARVDFSDRLQHDRVQAGVAWDIPSLSRAYRNATNAKNRSRIRGLARSLAHRDGLDYAAVMLAVVGTGEGY